MTNVSDSHTDITYDTTKSRALYERARAVIPQGVYGHYAHPASFGHSPVFFDQARGSRFTDIDGNTHIDWMCAYGPMILGYNHPGPDDAAATQMAAGNTVSLAAPVLVELAEQLVDMVTGGDWALFGKNGADSTTLALLIARHATGRKYVVKIDGGYHGSAAWMQSPTSPGIAPGDHDLVLSVPWNDAAALQKVIDEHPGEIACFMSSPYHHPVFADNALPDEGYWAAVESMCRAAGILIAMDDVRAGFRINLAGSHVAFGFQPDLMCFGKALANGHPIAAVMGSAELQEAASEVYYTGTQFFNAAPMAACLATLQEMQRIDAANLVTDIGSRLAAGLVDVAASHGHELRVSGVPAMPYLRLIGPGGSKFHARWIAECVRRGAYFLDFHNNFVSTAHTDEDLAETFAIADRAFAALATDQP